MSYVPSGRKPPRGRAWIWQVVSAIPLALAIAWAWIRFSMGAIGLEGPLETTGICGFLLFMILGLPLIARATKTDL